MTVPEIMTEQHRIRGMSQPGDSYMERFAASLENIADALEGIEWNMTIHRGVYERTSPADQRRAKRLYEQRVQNGEDT